MSTSNIFFVRIILVLGILCFVSATLYGVPDKSNDSTFYENPACYLNVTNSEILSEYNLHIYPSNSVGEVEGNDSGSGTSVRVRVSVIWSKWYVEVEVMW